MKKILFFFVLLFFCSAAKSQQINYYVTDPSEYLDTFTYKQNFSNISLDDQNNFKRLKAYWQDKQDLLMSLQEMVKYRFVVADLEIFIKGINHAIYTTNDSIIPISRISSYIYQYCRYHDGDINCFKTGSLVDNINKKDLNLVLDFYVYEKQKALALNKSIINVKKDIAACEESIDTVLDPAADKQSFRSTVTIVFGTLVFILMLLFFGIIYFKRVDDNYKNGLLNPHGLQFITLFIIIITILLFGILEIAKGSELIPIISSIAGFVLGNEALRRNQEKKQESEKDLNEKTAKNKENTQKDPETLKEIDKISPANEDTDSHSPQKNNDEDKDQIEKNKIE